MFRAFFYQSRRAVQRRAQRGGEERLWNGATFRGKLPRVDRDIHDEAAGEGETGKRRRGEGRFGLPELQGEIKRTRR